MLGFNESEALGRFVSMGNATQDRLVDTPKRAMSGADPAADGFKGFFLTDGDRLMPFQDTFTYGSTMDRGIHFCDSAEDLVHGFDPAHFEGDRAVVFARVRPLCQSFPVPGARKSITEKLMITRRCHGLFKVDEDNEVAFCHGRLVHVHKGPVQTTYTYAPNGRLLDTKVVDDFSASGTGLVLCE